MKKYNIYILLLLGIIIFDSCEKNKTELTYTGSNFIAYQDSLYSVEENIGSIVKIPISLAAPAQSSAISIDVAITSPDNSAVEGTHYNLLYPTDGKLNFDAGVFFDTIKVEVIDNGDEDGNKTLDFALGSVPAGFVLGLPGPAKRNKSCQLVVLDNDCEFISKNFTGKVTGVEFYPTNEYTTDAEFKLVDSTATTWIYEVHGIMQSVYAGWGEVVDAPTAGTGSKGNIAIVTLDFTDPINPKIYLTEQNLSTTDGGAWIYDIKNDPAKPSKFSTCESTIELNYLINVSEPGEDHGARAAYIKGEFVKE
jgi:hypothetical protein